MPLVLPQSSLAGLGSEELRGNAPKVVASPCTELVSMPHMQWHPPQAVRA